MSANNFLRITKKGNTYTVAEADADTGKDYKYGFKAKKSSLEDAIKAANEYMAEEEVEYGLDIRI